MRITQNTANTLIIKAILNFLFFIVAIICIYPSVFWYYWWYFHGQHKYSIQVNAEAICVPPRDMDWLAIELRMIKKTMQNISVDYMKMECQTDLLMTNSTYFLLIPLAFLLLTKFYIIYFITTRKYIYFWKYLKWKVELNLS